MEVIPLIQSNTLLQEVTMRFCCQGFLCDSRATFALVSQNITTTLRPVFKQYLCVFGLQIALTTTVKTRCTKIFLNSFEHL